MRLKWTTALNVANPTAHQAKEKQKVVDEIRTKGACVFGGHHTKTATVILQTSCKLPRDRHPGVWYNWPCMVFAIPAPFYVFSDVLDIAAELDNEPVALRE